uniref:Uncharacterized protein n=1 Tax=Arion vulgaris TaxID=1028688 RepID=A0A0B7AT72_9EUPU
MDHRKHDSFSCFFSVSQFYFSPLFLIYCLILRYKRTLRDMLEALTSQTNDSSQSTPIVQIWLNKVD